MQSFSTQNVHNSSKEADLLFQWPGVTALDLILGYNASGNVVFMGRVIKFLTHGWPNLESANPSGAWPAVLACCHGMNNGMSNGIDNSHFSITNFLSIKYTFEFAKIPSYRTHVVHWSLAS